MKDGKGGVVGFFADFVKRDPERDIDIGRGFEDGRYVFLHVVQDLNDGPDAGHVIELGPGACA